MRGTFTHNNLDFGEDVKHLADLGFQQISVEPVVAEPSEDYALREEDLPVLLEEYDRLAVELIKRQKEGKGVNFFHFMIDLSGGPCVAKRLSGCGSGTEYLAVTPWGDFYPCHQFVGEGRIPHGEMWIRELSGQTSGMNSKAVMCMPKTNVRTALPNFTAAAAARPILIISPAASTERMTWAVNSRKSALNVQL